MNETTLKGELSGENFLPSFMLDPLTLRNEIIALLGTELGTYTSNDGFTEPALAVLPDPDYGYNYPPSDTKKIGVECVILRPLPGYVPLLGGDRMKPYRWQITLKQWDTNKDLLEATEALVNGLDYLLTDPIHAPPNAGMGIIEQVRFEVIEYDYQAAT